MIGILAVAACGGESKVVRVYDGKIVEGRYIGPDAYAWFLRGVLAEDAGDLDGAITAYEAAVADDDEDAGVFARLGAARCARGPQDKTADEAFAKARKLDASYAGLLAAESRCALARGQDADAAARARLAAKEDPANVDIQALLVRAEARQPDPATRARAIALTLANGERPAAWDALIAWGKAHHDAELVARGFEGLLRAAPMRSGEVERGAVELLGEGHGVFARRVAAAVADAPAELLVRGPRDPIAARLAVDEALARGDEASARRRATRGHVELVETAARAALLEQRAIASSLGREVADADPASSAARMVLAALAATPRVPDAKAAGAPIATKPADARSAEARGAGWSDDAMPALCPLLFAARIADSDPDAARAWLAKIPRRALPTHDPVAGPLAVDLAARGVLAPSELGAELRVELAARRREPPPPADPALAEDLDAKHALLLASLTEPAGPVARALALRLADAGDQDPIVAFAVARVALATGEGPGGHALDVARRAAASSPADPLVLAAILELAKRAGRTDDVAATRARLMAVARTPAERALANE
jgi:hypothetical protein